MHKNLVRRNELVYLAAQKESELMLCGIIKDVYQLLTLSSASAAVQAHKRIIVEAAHEQESAFERHLDSARASCWIEEESTWSSSFPVPEHSPALQQMVVVVAHQRKTRTRSLVTKTDIVRVKVLR